MYMLKYITTYILDVNILYVIAMGLQGLRAKRATRALDYRQALDYGQGLRAKRANRELNYGQGLRALRATRAMDYGQGLRAKRATRALSNATGARGARTRVPSFYSIILRSEKNQLRF